MLTKKEYRKVVGKQISIKPSGKFPILRNFYRFERTVFVLGRIQSTFSNYSRHVAAISLYFGKILTQFMKPGQFRDQAFCFLPQLIL
jgi:hypothetical protein